MKKKIGMNRRNWALLSGGGLAAALVWVVVGCFNPIMPNTADVPADGPSVDAPSGDGSSSPGITWEEFTVTLRIGGAGRAVAGPDTEGIELGGIRNIVQVIAVEAGTENKVVHFEQAVRENDSAAVANLTVRNIWEGKRYHFLILMGHRERDYGAETDPSVKYEYKTDAPTLLAAGFLGDQTIPEGGTILAITMKPLVVDTGFTYGGVTAQAALGGIELPAGVDASLVWTITGDGLAMLVDAQTRTGHDGGWGGLTLAEGQNNNTILDLSAGGGGTKPAVLGGADRNRIVLDLGALEGGTSGSANFNLAYIPFGFGTMEKFTAIDGQAASWIIRNGVNDEPQGPGTTFTLTYDEPGKARIPWGTVYNDEGDTLNGNGAVGFTAVQDSIDLTGLVPAPVVGRTPQTSFYTTQYVGKVKWTPNHGAFQADTVYTATVTLTPAAGFVFSADLSAGYTGADSVRVTHEYDLSAYIPVPVAGTVLTKPAGETWVDYSTDKWEIKAWWYKRGIENPVYTDGYYKRGVALFETGASYGAVISLKAKPGYPFDGGADFKYPTYTPDNITGPVRGYYKFSETPIVSTYYDWLWQNNGGPRSPTAMYDTAPDLIHFEGDYSMEGDQLVKGNFHPNHVTQGGGKDRSAERFVMVGFNAQSAVPVPVSPPSGGGEGGARVAFIAFKPLGLPSNLDYGDGIFSEAVIMIARAQSFGSGYLSLTLDELTKNGTGKEGNPDISAAGNVSFTTGNSPSLVDINGGGRVVGGPGIRPPPSLPWGAA